MPAWRVPHAPACRETRLLGQLRHRRAHRTPAASAGSRPCDPAVVERQPESGSIPPAADPAYRSRRLLRPSDGSPRPVPENPAARCATPESGSVGYARIGSVPSTGKTQRAVGMLDVRPVEKPPGKWNFGFSAGPTRWYPSGPCYVTARQFDRVRGHASEDDAEHRSMLSGRPANRKRMGYRTLNTHRPLAHRLK